MSNLDPNAWYMLIYSDANYALSQGGSGAGAVHIRITSYTDTTQQWQILQLSSTGYVAIRSRSLGPAYYLNAFSCPDASCLSSTYCALSASSNINTIPTNQDWSLEDIGNGLTKIANRDNGTQAYLDAFEAFYVGLNSNTSSTTLGWTFSAVGQIDDQAFSTTASPTLMSATASSGSASHSTPTAPDLSTSVSAPPGPGLSSSISSPIYSSQSSDLSTGAKAGMGVGIAILVILVLALCLFFFFRRRSRRNEGVGVYTTPSRQLEKGETLQELGDERWRQELSGDGARPIYELNARPD